MPQRYEVGRHPVNANTLKYRERDDGEIDQVLRKCRTRIYRWEGHHEWERDQRYAFHSYVYKSRKFRTHCYFTGVDADLSSKNDNISNGK